MPRAPPGKQPLPLTILFAFTFGSIFGFIGFFWGFNGLPPGPFGTGLAAGLVGVVLGLWEAYRQPKRRVVQFPLMYALGFGAALGFVGFLCGLGGPTYLNPQSNLHPIIGFLVTGPAGVILGVAVGLWVAARRLSLVGFLGVLAIGCALVALGSLVLSLP